MNHHTTTWLDAALLASKLLVTLVEADEYGTAWYRTTQHVFDYCRGEYLVQRSAGYGPTP